MNKTIVIAEAGVNHNGSLELAKELIDAAAAAGADYVKFQTFIAEKSISKSASKASYQSENTDNSHESQLEMVKKLELSFNEFRILKDYSDKKGIAFLSTGFDAESLEFLKTIDVKIAKIPSGEITNLPYLRKVASLFEEIIISTGMATMEDISNALNVLKFEGVKSDRIAILHCNTEYPTPMVDVNLLAMLDIKNKFNTRFGYSDHTLGIEISIAAVALGANIIEKHFTLDKNMQGPDHKASLEPEELKQMITSIRNIELALGDGIKVPSASERKNMIIARKSLHTLVPLTEGTILSNDNLIPKRPGDGISPMDIDNVIGKILKYDLPEDHKLSYLDFE